MKNKIHSLIVEGVLFCGSGLGLLSYSLISYGKSFNKDWAQSVSVSVTCWAGYDRTFDLAGGGRDPDDEKRGRGFGR